LGDVADRIAGLELGADDYIRKPFSPKELESRISSILRRVKKTSTFSISSSEVLCVGPLRIDTNKRQVYKGDEQVRLTYTEFRLLELLARRAGKPVSRSQILQQVWGYEPEISVDTRVVDIHISHLRTKLEENPNNPELIITYRGAGYLFQRMLPQLPLTLL
jgi:OmpR family response regulator RpaB